MSLLAGAFPTRLRARVFGAALAAWGVGPGIGLTASGLLLGLAEHVPGFHLEAWRLAILGCAVPAFLLAPLLLFMREPPRTPAPRPESRSGGSATPWGPLAVTLLAIIAITVSDGAQLSWSVAALVREHAVPPATAARNAGYVFFFCGAAAPVFAGTLADRLYRSQGVGGRLIVAIAAILLLIPLQALYGVSGADQLLMVIVGTGCTVVTGEVVGAAVLQDITPDSRRGLAAAANGLCSSLAIGVGTSGVALAARGHPGAPHGTTDAMSLVTVPASALALLVFIWLWQVMRNRRTGTPSVQGVAETAAAPLPLRS
jgi:MFS family permease